MHACTSAPGQNCASQLTSHRQVVPGILGLGCGDCADCADWEAVVEYIANPPNGSMPLRAHLLADHRPCRIGGGKKRDGAP